MNLHPPILNRADLNQSRTVNGNVFQTKLTSNISMAITIVIIIIMIVITYLLLLSSMVLKIVNR